MGIGDHGLLSVGSDVTDVAASCVDEMVDDDTELISIYYGEDYSEEDAEHLSKELSEKYPVVTLKLTVVVSRSIIALFLLSDVMDKMGRYVP